MYVLFFLQFTMSNQSALMLTMNFGKKIQFLNKHISNAVSKLWFSGNIFFYCCLCSVRLFCPPFMLILNILVSLWAPGTHGTESRIKLVREFETYLKVTLASFFFLFTIQLIHFSLMAVFLHD